MIVKFSEENLDKGMNLRIGISAGEPVRNDNQLYGADYRYERVLLR